MSPNENHPVKTASPDHPIADELVQRWSPYSFAARAVPAADLLSLFEAARWAASSYNEQPWRFVVATAGSPAEHEQLQRCLVDTNRAWARKAPVLVLCSVSRHFERGGKPNTAAEHDLGLAVANLTFEATRRGLAVHQMIGIRPDVARELFAMPEGYDPFTALAIGYPAPPEDAEPPYAERDGKPRTRRGLDETVFAGEWGRPFVPARRQ